MITFQSAPTVPPRRSLTPQERVAAVAKVRRRVAETVDHQHVIRPGETVVVAVSGGPDSSVLLDVLSRLGATREWRLLCAHVDHGLRPGSDAEAAIVERLAIDRGVPFVALSADIPPRGSLQDRARRGRYVALAECADAAGASVIVTAHTADDQAETVLWRVLTGAPPVQLGGMAPRRGRLARPMLGVWRSEVEAYCTARELPVIRDPSNRDARFLRARVRHELLPAVESVFPGARPRLVALADAQRKALGSASRGAS